MPNQFQSPWTDERIATLTKMWAEGYSATRISMSLDCTRCAIIGKINRLGLPEPKKKLPTIRDMAYAKRLPEVTLKKRRIRENRYAKARRERRKYCLETKRELRQEFLARGTSPYSAAYRKHLPPAPEMSKSQMRDMLAQAMQNTAAL